MTARPRDHADRPDDIVTDALSDVLQAVRLSGAVFFEISAPEPWVAATPAGSTIVESIFPGIAHLIPYHVVTAGSCWAWALDEPPVHLSAGDIVVFPQGDAHVVSSAPGMRAEPALEIYRRPADGRLPFQVSMGDGANARPHRLRLPRLRRSSVQSAAPRFAARY